MPSTESSLDVLSEGDGAVVVVVDFPGIRSAAGFTGLVESAPSDVLVVGPVVTAELDAPSEVLARTQVDAWVDGLNGLGRPIAAVLGYCAGSAVAQHLAEELRLRAGATPTVAVIDPSWVDRSTIVSEYLDARSSLLRDQPDLAGPAPDHLHHPSLDVVQAARDMSADYRAAADRVARAMELPPDLMADLARRLDRYLTYLVLASAATTATESTLPAELTLLSGERPEQPLRSGREVRRFDASRDTLMARADVLDALWAAVLAPADREPPSGA